MAIVRALGPGTPGPAGIPYLTPQLAPLLGSPFSLRVLGAAPLATGTVFLSLESAPTPLEEYGALLYPAGAIEIAGFTTDDKGDSPETFAVDALDPSLCGLSVFVQAAVRDDAAQGGAAFSQGLELRVGPAPDQPEPLFVAPITPTGDAPRGNTLADVDGDGVLDAAVFTFGSSPLGGFFLEVYRGLGNGTFGVWESVAVPSGSGSLTAGDFNADGFADFALTVLPGGLQVWLGGSEGLTLAQDLQLLAGSAFAIGVFDLDEDGLLDLTVPTGSPAKVEFFRGRGDGTFEAPTILISEPFGSQEFEIADVTGDGQPDLVGLNNGFSGFVYVSEAQGDGTFGTPQIFDINSSTPEMQVADLDLDGWLDVALSSDTRGLLVLWGSSQGLVEPAVIYEQEFDAVEIAVADFDIDGYPDVFLGGTGDGSWLLRGEPDRSFGLAQEVPAPTIDGLAVGDLNRDGRLDAAAGSTSSDELVSLLGRGPGVFTAMPRLEASGLSLSVTTGDLDLDGFPDVAVGDTLSGDIEVYRGDLEGSFSENATVSTEVSARAVRSADLNGDGRFDLVAGSIFDNAIYIILSEEDRTFAEPVRISAGAAPVHLELVDLDDDGNVDVVAASDTGTRVSVWRGNGDGTFAPIQIYPVSGAAGAVDVADFNLDGNLDIAVSLPSAQRVRLLWGDGQGEFKLAAEDLILEEFPTHVAAGDLDGDGIPDLAVVANFSASAVVRIFLGQGDGGFISSESVVVAATSADELEVADFDGDGRLDVCAAAVFAGAWVGLGDGTGRIAQGTLHRVGKSPRGLAVDDLDLDGHLDVVVATPNSGAAFVLTNRGGE